MDMENAYVSYFDVLGFTSRFISGDLMHRYGKLINVITRINDPDVNILLFSDSIVIFSERFEKLKNGTQVLYAWGIIHDFWLRGAITRGNVTGYDTASIIREDKIILPFLGEGYLKAYGLESTLNISGIVIDDTLFSPEGGIGADLTRDVDYVEYEEYLPKRGYEGKKRLLLPREDSVVKIVDTMYFEEMLKSHVEDIDKYINTFCFFIKFLLDSASLGTVKAFLQKLLGNMRLHSQRVLIPSKVVIIFIVLIEGLLNRYRSGRHNDYSDPSLLELDISNILRTLKEQGYLPSFIDYLLDFDKKRHTNLYKDINNLRTSWRDFV
jgi:hypothetical protein